MRKYIILLFILFSAIASFAESVSNVRVRQEGQTMVITYDLNHHADIRLLMIHDELSNFKELKKTHGDVGKGVLGGKDRSIIWEVLEEYDKFIAKGVRFMVDVVTQSKHAYVDLGLSVKWATCNVGATKPEEVGHYFAWGETKPKSIYDWSTYKYCVNGSKRKITKYSTDPKYGNEKYVDNDTILDLSDDATYMNWGGSWRMPTYEECHELIHNCTVTHTGNSAKFTSKINGNSVIFPLGGYIYDDMKKNYVGYMGCYWSSTLIKQRERYITPTIDAWKFYVWFSCDAHMIGFDRSRGCSIRPVCP